VTFTITQARQGMQANTDPAINLPSLLHDPQLTPGEHTGAHLQMHTYRHTLTDAHLQTHTYRRTLTDAHLPYRRTLTDVHLPAHTYMCTLTDAHLPAHTFHV
jgi:hypothetical protein